MRQIKYRQHKSTQNNQGQLNKYKEFCLVHFVWYILSWYILSLVHFVFGTFCLVHFVWYILSGTFCLGTFCHRALCIYPNICIVYFNDRLSSTVCTVVFTCLPTDVSTCMCWTNIKCSISS